MNLKEQVDLAIEVLRRGGIILYPTDTVWGIGCDGTNTQAVDKIYSLKGSREKKSMLTLVWPAEQVSRYVRRVPEVAWQLLEMSDKPLTLILPGGCGVAENLLPEEGTIGIRIPDHEFCIALLRRLGRPLVSTSANLSGSPAPARFSEIAAEVCEGVDLVVDPAFEKGATGKPSSIIALGPGGEVKIIRE